MDKNISPLSRGKTPKLKSVRKAVSKIESIYSGGTLEEKRLFGWSPPAELEIYSNLFCCIFLTDCIYRCKGRPLAPLQGSNFSKVSKYYPLLQDPSVKYFACVTHFRKPGSELTSGSGKGEKSDILGRWADNPVIPDGYWVRIPTPYRTRSFKAWECFNADWKRLMMSNHIPTSQGQRFVFFLIILTFLFFLFLSFLCLSPNFYFYLSAIFNQIRFGLTFKRHSSPFLFLDNLRKGHLRGQLVEARHLGLLL
jgi:hypothetical protein